MNELLFVGLLALAGAALWRATARRGELHPLEPDDTYRHGALVFLFGLVLQQVLTGVLLGAGAEDIEDIGLPLLAASMAFAGVLAVVASFGLARRAFGVSLYELGVRRHVGPPAPLLALGAWMACFPLVAVANLVNRELAPWLLDESSVARQDYLERFLSEEGVASSGAVWLCMVVVIPVVEELIFRGALYGGLRRVMPLPAAMILSGVVFGGVHDGVAMLPAATLGVLLAWLYERTGSLVVPSLAHMFQNGFTLSLASLLPESV